MTQSWVNLTPLFVNLTDFWVIVDPEWSLRNRVSGSTLDNNIESQSDAAGMYVGRGGGGGVGGQCSL